MRGINILISVCSLFLGMSCTEDHFINTGISNGRFDGSAWEYMQTNPYDWSMTVEMIRHAGNDIVALFEGKDEVNKEITFWGITNHSIRRYLLEQGIEKVSDFDVEWCRSILRKHIVPKKVYRMDIPKGELGPYNTVGPGGVNLETIAGTTIWVYMMKRDDEETIKNGASSLGLIFTESNRNFAVASANLESDNAVIHALEYKFTLGDEEK